MLNRKPRQTKTKYFAQTRINSVRLFTLRLMGIQIKKYLYFQIRFENLRTISFIKISTNNNVFKGFFFILISFILF